MDKYSLKHLSEHLYLAERFDELYELLLNENWYQASQHFDPSRGLFIHDIETTIKSIESLDASCLPKVIGLSILETVCRSLTTRMLPETLGAMAALGNTEIALNYAKFIEVNSEKARAYLLIAEQLCLEGKHQAAYQLIKQTLPITEIETEKSEERRLRVWAATLLIKVNAMKECSTFLANTEDYFIRRQVLCNLVEAFNQTENTSKNSGLIKDLLMMLDEVKDYELQRSALAIGKTLTKLGKADELSLIFAKLQTSEFSVATVAAEITESIAHIDPKCIKVIEKYVHKAASNTQGRFSPQVKGLAAQALVKLGKIPESEELIAEAFSQIDATYETLIEKKESSRNDYGDDKSDSASFKVWSLLRLARAMAYAGKVHEVAKILEEITETSVHIRKLGWQSEVLVEVARIMILIEDCSPIVWLPQRLHGNFWDRDLWIERTACDIAKELAEAGKFDYAFGVLYPMGLQRVYNQEFLADVIGFIGRAMADAAEFEKTMTLVEGINSVYLRIHLLSVVAQNMANMGKTGEARDILNSVFEIMESVDSWDLMQPDTRLILALTRLTGITHPKTKLISMLSAPNTAEFRIRSSFEIISILDFQKDADQVLTLIDKNMSAISEIEDLYVQVSLYRKIAEFAATLNEWELVRQIKDSLKPRMEAERITGLRDTTPHRQQAYSEYVAILALLAMEAVFTGDHERALSLTEEVAEPQNRPYETEPPLVRELAGNLLRMILDLTEDGEMHMTGNIRYKNWEIESYQQMIWRSIADALIANKRFDLALSIIEKLKDERLAYDWARFDTKTPSVPLIKERNFEQTLVLSRLITSLTLSGEIVKVREIIEQIENDYSRSVALSSHGYGLLSLESRVEAEQVFLQAFDIAERCQDLESKIFSLSWVANGFFELGKTEKTKQILASAQEIAARSKNPLVQAQSTTPLAVTTFFLNPFSALILAMNADREDYQLLTLEKLSQIVQLQMLLAPDNDKRNLYWLEWHLLLLRQARDRSKKLLVESIYLFAPTFALLMTEQLKKEIWTAVQSAISVLLPDNHMFSHINN